VLQIVGSESAPGRLVAHAVGDLGETKMHAAAMQNAKRFFDTYVSRTKDLCVLEIGSRNINGSIREVCPQGVSYIGLDCEPGKDVDRVQEDPYVLPFEDGSFDVVVSSSCFEHSEMFWLLYLEVMRVLSPSGLLWLSVPSVCPRHRFPVDCWRFNSDSGVALLKWGLRNGYNSALLESYIGEQSPDVANYEQTDFFGIFIKDENCVDRYPNRILRSFSGFTSGLLRDGSGHLREVAPAGSRY
jgi:SAM-dependent methyltransferase